MRQTNFFRPLVNYAVFETPVGQSVLGICFPLVGIRFVGSEVFGNTDRKLIGVRNSCAMRHSVTLTGMRSTCGA